MTHEFLSAMTICASVPLVTLHIPATRDCAWRGKWSLNTNTAAVEAMGGPWDTEADAIAAVLQTGRWKLRLNTSTTHFDKI